MAHAQRAVVNVLNLLSMDLLGSRAPWLWPSRQLALRGEKALLRSFPRICTLTPGLSDYARKVNPRASVHTIPLGMDLALYEFKAPTPAQGPPTVSLIGSFGWMPTSSAAMRILTRLWPAIQRGCPEARLQFVGRNARSVLRHCGGKEWPGVSVRENVPDILPYFHATDVLLYPVEHGSGMKVKVLEAFALGVSVVTTSVGVEGMPAKDGVHAGITEEDQGLIERTVHLLRNSGARAKQCIAARELVERHCSPGRTLDLLEAVYSQMMAETL